MMRRGVLEFGLGLALVVATASSPVLADPQRASPSETARRIHDRGRYPNDLLVEPERQGGSAGSRAPVPIFGSRNAPVAPPDPTPWWSPDWDFDIPFLRELLAWLGWGALVVIVGAIVAVVAFVLFLLFRMRAPIPSDAADTKRRRRAAPTEEPLAVDPLLQLPELDHEELARLGRFREAAHALLVAALLATGWAPEGRGRGLTAREIVASYQRPSPPREPLEALLGLVERVWFGGREATRATYEEALGLFRAFAPERSPS